MTCRGFQELNVALGGTLKHEQEDLPEGKKHGTPQSAKSEDERFRIRQKLNVVPGGMLAAILKSSKVRINSQHSQLIDELAPGLAVEATADDGSVEAATVREAKGFGLAVIFHPEYWAERPSRAILKAFGTAVQAYACTAVQDAVSIAALFRALVRHAVRNPTFTPTSVQFRGPSLKKTGGEHNGMARTELMSMLQPDKQCTLALC